MDFCDVYNIKSLMKVLTCFKNPEGPTSIDVMLTKSYRGFQNSCTILKTYFQRKEPKLIQCRDYKIFSEGNIGNSSFLIMINVHSMTYF